MNYKIKTIVILFSVFVVYMLSGCIEDSRDNLEIGKEYEIINAKFLNDNKEIEITYVINNTFDDIQVAFVEIDPPTSKYKATGVYIQDNRSYFKLIRKLTQRGNNLTSPPIYHFEIHMTNADLSEFIK